MLKRLALAAFCALLLSQSARAALLVYEGYNGYASGTLSGKTPNINTVGLDQATAYDGNGPQHYTLQTNSLNFSPNFLTSGGSVSFIGTSSVAAARMSLSTSYQGTLYVSYLVNLDTIHATTSNGAQTRISNDNGTGSTRFILSPDSRNSSNAAHIAYNGTGVNGSVLLAEDTTYLILGRFTNVGTSLSAGNPGVGTFYALTEAQYESFLVGGGTDAYLDSIATVGTGNNQITARFGSGNVTSGASAFTTGNFMHLVSVGTSGSFDEIRYGSSLADVTPIPEPGAWLGLTAAAIGCGVWRGRRKSA